MQTRNERLENPLFAAWVRPHDMVEGKKSIVVYPQFRYILAR